MIYLDHAATTPLDPAVADVVAGWLDGRPANPSAGHAAGRAARAAVETAREQVAAALAVDPLDVVFTSGGTEADNLAVIGLARAARAAGTGHELVVSAIEHHAVLEAARWLAEHEGFTLKLIAPTADGVIDPDRVLDAVGAHTALVAVMAANNELGTVQPVATLGAALAQQQVAFHVDAVQAFGRIPVEPARWQASALALSAHKFAGPTGVGVLVLRRDVPCAAPSFGGSQERGVRAGTLHTAGIAGAGAAAELAAARLAEDPPQVAARRDRLAAGLLALDGVRWHGAGAQLLPGHLHLGIDGVDGDALLAALDAAGIAASAASACQSGAAQASHVLAACGLDAPDRAHLRLTLGRSTTDADVDEALKVLTHTVAALRARGGGFV